MCFAIRRKFNRPECPDALNIIHNRILKECFKSRTDVFPDLRGTFHQMLVFEDLEIGKSGSAGKRMPAIGAAVAEFAAGALIEHGGDLRRRNGRAERQIAAGDRLAHGQDVRNNVPVFAGEPFSCFPESALHFVEDQDDVISVTECADPLQIAVRGHRITAVRTRKRIHDDCRDGLRRFGFDQGFKRLEACHAAGTFFQPQFTARTLHLRGEKSSRKKRFDGFAQNVESRERGRAERRAVIRAAPGDHLVLSFAVRLPEILAGHLDGGFVCLGTAVQKAAY